MGIFCFDLNIISNFRCYQNSGISISITRVKKTHFKCIRIWLRSQASQQGEKLFQISLTQLGQSKVSTRNGPKARDKKI